MRPQVYPKTVVGNESLLAIITAVRPLSRVIPLVHFQCLCSHEGFKAGVAVVRPLARVLKSHVHFQMRGRRTFFLAMGTLVGRSPLLPRVPPYVIVELEFRHEGLPAQLAHEVLFFRVHVLDVRFQGTFQAEGSLAQGALELRRFQVEFQVGP